MTGGRVIQFRSVSFCSISLHYFKFSLSSHILCVCLYAQIANKIYTVKWQVYAVRTLYGVPCIRVHDYVIAPN